MKQDRTLVLGGGGMLGHKMVQALVRSGDDVSFTLRHTIAEAALGGIEEFADATPIEKFDAEDVDAALGMLKRLTPAVTINCIGVVKQRGAATAPIPSITVNSLLPHRLAVTAAAWGGKVIHFSTDCVFSGKRGHYSEEDLSDAEDLYGRTKYLGEVDYPNALTLRTSIIGRELSHHQSLLDWFLSQNGREISGFRRAWWSGVTTNHLSELVSRLLRRDAWLSGLYQVSSGRISKYDLLLLARDAYGLNVSIKPDDSVFCDRSLVGAKLQSAIGYVSPALDAQIAQLIEDPTPYPTLS